MINDTTHAPRAFTIGETVLIRFRGRNGPVLAGEGVITKICKRWVEVTTPKYARPVRYRTTGDLAGKRISGGIAQFLNDYIDV
jgi:hypothetical protein